MMMSMKTKRRSRSGITFRRGVDACSQSEYLPDDRVILLEIETTIQEFDATSEPYEEHKVQLALTQSTSPVDEPSWQENLEAWRKSWHLHSSLHGIEAANSSVIRHWLECTTAVKTPSMERTKEIEPSYAAWHAVSTH
jgi:hypothetical protein